MFLLFSPYNLQNLQEILNSAFVSCALWEQSFGEKGCHFYLNNKATCINILNYIHNASLYNFAFLNFSWNRINKESKMLYWKNTANVNTNCLCENWMFNSQSDSFISTHFHQNSYMHTFWTSYRTKRRDVLYEDP